MQTAMATIERAVAELKQDESLLYLNHILAVSRSLAKDAGLEEQLAALRSRPLAYVVHFVAKQILLHSHNFGRYVLDWPRFLNLLNLLNELEDPIQDDPNWEHSNPTGFFERAMQQQLPSQDRKIIQKYGLYLGLYRDVGIADGYYLRTETETTLGMSVEDFMALAHVCGSLRRATLGVGTFTSDYLTDAYAQGIRVCKPELWQPFLRRMCCTPKQFRERQIAFSTANPAYPQFEFNLLRYFPIIEITRNRFISIDPDLIVQRATFGLFYDQFDQYKFAFAERFGHSFEKYVGILLGSALAQSMLWSHAKWKQDNPTSKIPGTVSDWAYVTDNHTILFESKSLRPTAKLTTVCDEQSLSDTTERIVDGLKQMIGHNREIANGRWETAGLPRRDATAFVLVMYGQLFSVNTVFWRNRIVEQLQQSGLETRPFVVLSLSDLDTVVRLVELGHSLESVIVHLCDGYKSLNDYPELKTDAVSSISKSRTREFLDRIVSAPAAVSMT